MLQDYYAHTRTVNHDEGYDFRQITLFLSKRIINKNQYECCILYSPVSQRNDLEVDRSAEGNYSTELYGARAAQIIRF